MKKIFLFILLLQIQTIQAQNEPFNWNLPFSEHYNSYSLTPDKKILVVEDGNNHIRFWDIENRFFSHDLGSMDGQLFIIEADNKNDVRCSETMPYLALKRSEQILNEHWNDIKRANKTGFLEKYFLCSVHNDYTISIYHIASDTRFRDKKRTSFERYDPYSSEYRYFISKNKKEVLRNAQDSHTIELIDIQSDSAIVSYNYGIFYVNSPLYENSKEQVFFSMNDTATTLVCSVDFKKKTIDKIILPNDTIIKDLRNVQLVGVANQHNWLILYNNGRILLFDIATKKYRWIDNSWYNCYQNYLGFSENDEYYFCATDKINYFKVPDFSFDKSYQMKNSGNIFPKTKRQIKETEVYSDYYPIRRLYHIWDVEKNKKIYDIPFYFNAKIEEVSENQRYAITAFNPKDTEDRYGMMKDYLLWDLQSPKFPFSFSQRRFLSPIDTAVEYCKIAIDKINCCDFYRRYYDSTGCYKILKQEKLSQSIYRRAYFSNDEYKNQYVILAKHDDVIEIWDVINMKLVLEKKLSLPENNSSYHNKYLEGFTYKGGYVKYHGAYPFSFLEDTYIGYYQTDFGKYDFDPSHSDIYALSSQGTLASFFSPFENNIFLRIQKHDDNNQLKTNYLKINTSFTKIEFTEDEHYLICTDEYSQIKVLDAETMKFVATLPPFGFGDKNYKDYITPDKKWRIWKWNNFYEILKNE